MLNKLKVAVLISGRGSNLKSLIENAKDYEIIAVLSNNPEALGLNIAKESGIPTFCFDKNSSGNNKALKVALLEKLKELKPGVVALAGFMMILSKDFMEAFPNGTINIHPALLPNFPGLDTHKRALESKAREHGCTVHLVDAGVDTGAIIAQMVVPVLHGDTEQSLSERVLKHEHQLYPWVLNNLANGSIKLADGSVRFQLSAIKEAKISGIRLPSA